jgi:hypothetical protein
MPMLFYSNHIIYFHARNKDQGVESKKKDKKKNRKKENHQFFLYATSLSQHIT